MFELSFTLLPIWILWGALLSQAANNHQIIKVVKNSDVLLQSPNYGSGKPYQRLDKRLTLQGGPSCRPQIRCPALDLLPDPIAEFIHISDRHGGGETLTGNRKLEEWVSGHNDSIELSVWVRLSEVSTSRPRTGFQCIVQCIPEKCLGAMLSDLLTLTL